LNPVIVTNAASAVNATAAITAIATLLASSAAALMTWQNAKRARITQDMAIVAQEAAEAAKAAALESKAEIMLTKDGVAEVGRAIDGRLTQLLEEVKKTSRAEGFTAGAASRGPAPHSE
jgi:hypothetical protein